jgi:two-component system response regulator
MKHAPLRPILLVEDSPFDAEMTMDALRQAHLANPVVHVEDGVDCLDWLHARGGFTGRQGDDPAVVLLDIKMPRMNGLDVLKQMRANERFRHLPVVILSSSREERDLARSWDLGVNAYVIKPVDVEQFFQAVRTLGQFWGVLNQSPEQG